MASPVNTKIVAADADAGTVEGAFLKALFVAGAALLLCIPIILWRTNQDMSNRLVLTLRPVLVAVIVGMAFVGALLVELRRVPFLTKIINGALLTLAGLLVLSFPVILNAAVLIRGDGFGIGTLGKAVGLIAEMGQATYYLVLVAAVGILAGLRSARLGGVPWLGLPDLIWQRVRAGIALVAAIAAFAFVLAAFGIEPKLISNLWTSGAIVRLVFAFLGGWGLFIVVDAAGRSIIRLGAVQVLPKIGIVIAVVLGSALLLLLPVLIKLFALVFSRGWSGLTVVNAVTETDFKSFSTFYLALAAIVGTAASTVFTQPRLLAGPAGVVKPEQVAATGLSTLGTIVLILYPFLALHFTGAQGSIKWIDNFGIQILIYIMLGWGLNIVVGLAGLLDLGYVAFYAVGAYSYALLATQVIPAVYPALGPWAFWICLPLAGILAAFWGVLLGFPVLRLRGDYLAIVTLAFGEIIRLVLINWSDVTKGYEGISSIPRPSFFGIPFNASDQGFAAKFGLEFTPLHRTIFLFYVILALAFLTNLVTIRLRRLPVGRAWEALREDEIACRSLGMNTTNTKLTSFAIGAGFGGLAGTFFAARQGFISPESFVFMESAVILAIVVLGGMGSQLGVAIAAVVMIGGTEILRELDFLKLLFGNDFDPTQYRMLLFGIGMVWLMIVKPRGLISTREPTMFLKERKAVSGSLVKEGHG